LCPAAGFANLPEMSASPPLQLPPEDKLDVLRYLDEFHYWHSLDDTRICRRCGRIITGRQIVVVQATPAELRLQCPSAGCVSTPGDWPYTNPVQTAKCRVEFLAVAEKAKIESAANERTDHAERAAKRKVSTAATRRRILAPAPSFRAAAARLILLRPIATALHAFRPIT
jgi:hypothetical protein